MKSTNKPAIRFKGYNDAWEQRKLVDICIEMLAGGDINKEKIVEQGNYPVVANALTNEGVVGFYEHEYRVKAPAVTITGRGDVGHAKARKVDFTPVVRLLAIRTNHDVDFIENVINTLKIMIESTGVPQLTVPQLEKYELFIPPTIVEEKIIGAYFRSLDYLITLHQRECKNQNGRCHMLSEVVTTDLFCDYYIQWVKVYKEGAVRKVTLDKYMMTYSWLLKLASHLRLCDITRVTYQQILNDYAITHEKQTTMDFHHQLKGAIADAVDDGLITKDPTRKAIIKGKTPTPKKIKYLNQYELHTLLSNLQLKDEINWDWLILLVAKTGMRFSEALAITPSDFDFAHQMLSISKTWNYKGNGGFLPTKNKSSVRKIQLDWQTVIQFSELVKRLPPEKPIFITKERVYNSTVNDVLARHCTKNNIPVISIHGLRHTHASLLLFAGVSIASVARRLGHSSMTTTQKTYLHIIQELENKDIDLVMRSLSGLS